MLRAIFVGIHPFIDGNRRTSRLLLKIIKVENRLANYEVLDKAHTTQD